MSIKNDKFHHRLCVYNTTLLFIYYVIHYYYYLNNVYFTYKRTYFSHPINRL